MAKLLNSLYSRLFCILFFIIVIPQTSVAQSNDFAQILNNHELTASEANWLKNQTEITVAVMDSWPPFNFLDKNGKPTGIGPDLIKQINQQLDNKLTIVPGKWKDIYEAVKQQEFDVILDITPKKEREAYFNFTSPYLDIPHIFIAQNSTEFIQSESSLGSKTVALEKGFGNVKYFKTKYPEVNLKLYKDTIEALEAVSRGEADAYAGNRVVALYLLEKLAFSNLKVHGRLSEPSSILAIGTRKNAPILRDILQKSLNIITVNGLREITNNWIHTIPVTGTQNMISGQNPSASSTIATLQFTPEEETWLKNHPEIRLGVDSAWDPLEYIDKQGQYQGLSSDYMDYFSRQLGIIFKTPEKMPWILVIRGLQEKTIDIAPLIAKTEKRTHYLNFTDPYQKLPLVLFNRRGQTLLRGLMDLQEKKIGVVNGYAVSESLSQDYPEMQQVYFQNTKKGLEALSVGEIDAFIDVLAVGGYLMASSGLSNLQVASSTPYNYEFSIGVRNDWPELIGILNKAISQLPTEKKNEFLKNWLVLPAVQKIDYTLIFWVLGIALFIFFILGLRAREMTRVNEKLRENRERLSLSLESAELGTWEITFQKDGEPIFIWDETFARQHKLPNSHSLKKSVDFYNYLSPDYIEEVKTTLSKYIKGNTAPLKAEYLTRFNNRWISSQGRIFERDAKGWAHRIVGISQDITERKESHLALERSSQFKSQFLSNMSHEIRTPMNAIVGLGHLLSKTEINDKQADYINNLQKSSQTLLSLIDDILDLSKIEAGHLTIENIQFSLEELLNDLANISIIRITKKVDFIYDMGIDVPDVLSGDPFRINQVLTNLVSNSIKFTESGNIILRISVIEKQEKQKHKICLQFEVNDTGIGIAPDKLENLFDPFVQEDGSTTRKYGGTGLGLSISKQLIELMGGEIGAESIQGKGSKFYFRLPFTVLKSNSQSLLLHPSPDLRGLNILLVDDNPLSLSILRKTLESMSFEVTAVSSGKQAVELLLKAGSKLYDVVLLDWRMPDMDGEKTALQIRKKIPKDKLPIIILMTAYGREAAEQKIDHMPLDGYLVKPITPSQLFNAIIQARKGLPDHSEKHDELKTHDQILIDLLNGQVLLAEDNKINQQVAQEILQQMGLKVTICCNGVDVLKALEIFTPDLILMDIQMPEMDGYEATIKIRHNPVYKDLPIIAMTANAMLEDVEKSLQTGMNGHISKPVDPQLLYQTLSEYLPKQQENALPVSSTEKGNGKSMASYVSWPDSIPGLNIKQGIKQIGGNEQLYQKLIKDFVRHHSQLVTQLQQALASGDIEKAERVIHTIKGVSGNIGADKLMDITTEIDHIFKKNKFLPENIMNTLNETCDELFNSLQPLISIQTEHDTDNLHESTYINHDEFLTLKTALQTGDSKSLEIIHELTPTLITMFGQEAIKTLINLVEDYEFEQAAEWLLKLSEGKLDD